MFALHFLLVFSVSILLFTLLKLYKEGDIVGVNLLFVTLLILSFLFTSCSVEEALDPPTCMGGNCSAEFYIDGELDENGYYHVKLNWDGEYNPRFNIDIISNLTDTWYWYNGSPVIQANFYTDDMIDTGYEKIPIVQPTRVYLSQQSENSAYGKRIVGPVSFEYKNDTIYIEPEISWEAGSKSIFRTYNFLKIIVE